MSISSGKSAFILEQVKRERFSCGIKKFISSRIWMATPLLLVFKMLQRVKALAFLPSHHQSMGIARTLNASPQGGCAESVLIWGDAVASHADSRPTFSLHYLPSVLTYAKSQLHLVTWHACKFYPHENDVYLYIKSCWGVFFCMDTKHSAMPL